MQRVVHLCTEDLRLVFRQDGDSGSKRVMPTPGSQMMLLDKWKNLQDCSGITVFTLASTRKLKSHILNECLSNIPPGGGTNRNKQLHCSLNALFTRCKIGVRLAYALLTISIHALKEVVVGE